MDLFDIAVSKKLVGGGGGGSSFTKIAEKDIEVSTTTTSATTQGEIELPENYSDRLLWVSVRDKDGKRNGYYYGSDSILTPNSNEGSLSNNVIGRIGYSVDSSGKVRPVQSSYGVMPYGGTGVKITISSRYNSTNTLTINGTFHIEVYVLDWPNGVSPFN